MLFLHSGGLGDQVLFSGMLAALHAARPDLRLSVVVPAGLAEAVRTMSPWLDEIVPTPFDPYLFDVASVPMHDVSAAFLDALPSEPFDVVAAAECRPTWLSWLVAGRVRPAQFITLHRSKISLALLRSWREAFALRYPRAIRYASASVEQHERERYTSLLAAFGISGDVVARWRVADAYRSQAAELAGIEAGRYVTCFPGGAASVPHKRWPVDRFAAVLQVARDEFALEPLVVGTAADASDVDALVRACRQLGFEARVWQDPANDFVATRAVLGSAAAFLGNDSGPAHVSQACGVPGVAVFGGGTYPAYVAWGTSAVASVNPLPCFGCDWDCAFGRAFCVDAVSAADVAAAFRSAVASGKRAPHVAAVANIDDTALAVIASASRTYRVAERDRAARLEAIEALRRSKRAISNASEARLARAKHAVEDITARLADHRERMVVARAEIAALRATSEERLAQLNAAAAEANFVRGQAEERLKIVEASQPDIERLHAALRTAHTQIAELSAALMERDGVLAATEELNASAREWIAEREGRIALLQRTADERVAVIESSAAAQFELGEKVRALQMQLESHHSSPLPQPEYAMAAGAPADDGRVSELEGVAHERLLAIQKLDAELTSVRTEAVRRAEILAEMTDMLERQGREIERLRARGR